MSILPKNAVTLPWGVTAIHESSSSGSSSGLASAPAPAWPNAPRAAPGMAKLTTRAPPALRRSRREMSVGLMAAPYAFVPAARFTARRMAMWVPHRHLRPPSASRICRSVGLGVSRSSAAAVSIQPERQ